MWQKLISQLLDNGHTQAEIAAACDTSQSNISALYTGEQKQPRWPLGDALIKFHAKSFRKKKAA